jgi:hypothetical protein
VRSTGLSVVKVPIEAGANRNNLVGHPVALLPTFAEQRAIAEALNDADALIESLEQLIAKQRTVKQGAMQELLTGRIRPVGRGAESGVYRAGVKISVTKYARQHQIEFAWQARNHDHIVRDAAEYQRIRTYIVENPKKWWLGILLLLI